MEVLPYFVAHHGRYYDWTAVYEFLRNICSVFGRYKLQKLRLAVLGIQLKEKKEEAYLLIWTTNGNKT